MKKFFLITLSSFLVFASCSQFGENPSGEHLEEIKNHRITTLKKINSKTE